MGGNSTTTRRRFLTATGGLAAAGAVGTAGATPGKGKKDKSKGDERGGSDSGRYLRRLIGGFNRLDPAVARDTGSGEVIRQVFDTLFAYTDGEATPEPVLVTGYEASDDFSTYTFSLKEGVQFHNGEELTADDVVYSFERIAASFVTHRVNRWFLLKQLAVVHERDEDDQYIPGTLGVEAIDDHTVRMEFERGFHATFEILGYTALSIIPEGLVKGVPGYPGEMFPNDFAESPVGSGPFTFESIRKEDDGDGRPEEIRVSRFDDYHEQNTNAKGVRWLVVDDDAAERDAILAGDADVFEVPTPYYDPGKVTVEETDARGRKLGTYDLDNGATVNYSRTAQLTTFYIAFNTERVPKPVRQAFAYAFDQHATANEVFKDRVAPAYHFTPPLVYPGTTSAYRDHAEGSYPYGYAGQDIDAAKAVMEDAGYGPDNRATVRFTTYFSEAFQTVGGRLRAALEEAYIDVELEQLGFGDLLQQGRSGQLDAYTLGWAADWPAADNFMQLLYPPNTDTSEESPLLYANWGGTPAADRAADAYERIQANLEPTASAEAAREESYVTMEEAAWEDVVMLPVNHGVEERFWYDHVEIPVVGTMGTSRQQYDDVLLKGRGKNKRYFE